MTMRSIARLSTDTVIASVIIVIGVVGFSHLACIGGKFQYDDLESLVENPMLDELGFRAPEQSPLAGRPVAILSFGLDTLLWGKEARLEGDARGYHLQSWLVHLANTLLVWYLLSAAFRTSLARPLADELARAAALLWGVHPLQTEAVTYLTQRTELLVTLFTLAALASTVRRVRTGSPRWTVAALASALLACGSKETAATIPILALLFDRAFFAGSWRELFRARAGHHLALASATWSVVGWTLAQGFRSESVGFGIGIGPWGYLKTQAWAIARYARLVLWPDALSIDYGPPPELPLGAVLLPGIAILAAAAAAIVVFIRRPRIGVAALLPFVALAPTSTFIPIATEFAAERRMYLALLGPVVLAVLCFEIGARKSFGAAAGIRVRRVLVAILVVVLIALTNSREREYADPIALWRGAAELHPGNARAFANLGVEYAAVDRIEEAERAFERTLELDPGRSDTRWYLAGILLARGDWDRAALHLARIEGEYAEDPRVRLHSGLAFERVGSFAEAIHAYREALRMAPGEPTARVNLAWLLATCPAAERRDPRGALALLAPVWRPGGGSAAARDAAAAALAASGRFDEALREASALAEAARALAEREGSPRALETLAMLERRCDAYRRWEAWVDSAETGVPRFQGALRDPTFELGP